MINQFLKVQTNQRDKEYSCTFNNRMSIATNIVQEMRNAIGKDFILMFCLSMIDLIPNGSIWD